MLVKNVNFSEEVICTNKYFRINGSNLPLLWSKDNGATTLILMINYVVKKRSFLLLCCHSALCRYADCRGPKTKCYTDHFKSIGQPDENFVRKVGAERNTPKELDLLSKL